MTTIYFDKKKYGYPLQMDLGMLEETPNFFFSPEVHCTNFFEILMFEKVNGYIKLDQDVIELSDRQFLFLSPFQKRSWYVEQAKIKGLFLVFEKDFLAEFFSDKLFVYRLQYFYNRNIKTTFHPKEKLFGYNGIIKEILVEINNFQKDSPHLLRAMLYYMLIKLNRSFCEAHQLENDTQLNNTAFLFKEAIEKDIKTKQQVNDYAQLLGVSRVTLNKLVKNQFGITATEMIKERLIFEIKSELLFSTKNISEIAYELHFSEVNNLIRFFKNKTGVSPGVFRQSYHIDS